MVPGPEDNITTSTISTAQAQYEEQLALGRSSRASKTKSQGAKAFESQVGAASGGAKTGPSQRHLKNE